jgi:hypothetical protein
MYEIICDLSHFISSITKAIIITRLMTNNPSFFHDTQGNKIAGCFKKWNTSPTNILFFEMPCRWQKRKHTH